MNKLFCAMVLMPLMAFADTEVVDGITWRYTVKDGKASVGTGLSPYSYLYVRAISSETTGMILIPSSLGGYPVTSISNYAFDGCNGLTSVTIPLCVTSIGDFAFCDCSGMTSLTIPTSATNIGNYAFSGCSGLTSVTIPSSVTNIGSSAFSGCSGLKTVTIPEGVTSIGNSVFYGCSGLKTVSIREGVRSIGSSAFSGCSGLTSVTIPSSVTSIGDSAFSGCSGLRSVSISPGVASIGVSAFSDCSRLATIVIPPSVTKIAAGAFDGCRRLTSVTIPPCVTKLSDTFADSYEMMQSVVLSERTCIGPDMFSGCVKLKSVMIPTSVETIGGRAFNSCAELTAITIPSTVTNIVSDAFDGCDMIKVVFVEGESQECVKECFGDRVWYQKIGMPINYQWEYVCEDGNATITGVRPAYGDVVVPSSCDGFPVTSIGESAFAGCGGLTSVTIPDCVTNFGYDAFAGCTNLNVVLECNCPENYEGSGITSVRSVEFWCDNLESYPVAEERIDSTYIGSSCALVIDADDGKTYTQFVGEMEPSSSLSEYCRLAIGCNGEIRFLRPEEYSITLHYGWKHIVARIEGEYADRWHLVLGNPAFREYIGNNDEWFYQYWNRGSLAERDDCRRGDVIAITPQDGDWPWIYYSEFDYQMGEYADFLDGIYYYYLPVVDDVDVMYYPEYAYGRYSGLVVNIDVPGRNTEFYVKPESDPIFVEYDLGLPAGNVVVKSYQPDWEIRDPWYGEWVDIKPYYNAYTMTDCECGECVDYPYYVLHQPGWTVADGWRFVGWKDDQGTFCENIYIDWYPSYEDSVRFEAQYELIQYGLTYVDEKGFVLSNPQEFNVTDAVDLEEPPNVFGWLFLGWFDESENRITNTSQLSAQDHTLTAKWEQIYHEVLFNPGAHGRLRNVKLVKQNIARGAQAAVPEIDLAPGWRFLGWDGDVTQPITNDVTFTAQYEAIEYKLSFEGLKGGAVDYPTTFTVTNSISLVPLADTEDFRFDYWLVNGEIADVIPVGTAVDTVVVAHWTPFVKLGEGGITGWSGMYDGTEHTVSVSVAEPESYSVSCSRLVSGLPTGSWTSMKDVGTVAVRVTVSAEGYAPISRDVTVDITARPLSTCTLETSGVANYINGPVTWSKRAYDPVAKTTLSDSRDYSVSFVQTGDFTGRATFTGRGNYTGTENVQTVISITTPFETVGNTTWYYQQFADKATLVRRGDAIASSLMGGVVIPSTVNGLPVTEIADGAFANCSDVTAFVIPEGVAILGDGVFAGCSALKSVAFLGDAPEAPRTFGGAPAELIVYAMPGSRGWGAPVHDVLPERWPFGDDESLTRVIALLPEVEITPTTGIRSGRVAVTMNYAGVPGIEREIRYTSDGTDPVAASTLYDKRFSLNVDEKTVVKAAAFCGGYRFGSVSSSTFLTSLEEVIVNEGSGAVVLANDVSSPWTYDDTELGCGGKACLRSGAISDNMTSSLTATFEGEGLLTFSWKTDCEYDDFGEFFFDHAECLLDGVVVAQADDETDWTDVEIPVGGKGVHSLVWRYVKDDADEDGADYEDCVWLGNVAFSCAENELLPTVVGDEGAVVTGDEEIGFVIRPSGTKTVVEVEIPTGLDAAKVTVEVTVTVTSLKSNGAKVKIVSGGADITEFLDLPSADGEGVIDLSRAAVRSEIVNEVLDPAKGAVIELMPDSPILTTANTRPGLVYTLHEGAALDGMTSGDSKVGDGEPWTPEITVKGGNSAFYFISVGK